MTYLLRPADLERSLGDVTGPFRRPLYLGHVDTGRRNFFTRLPLPQLLILYVTEMPLYDSDSRLDELDEASFKLVDHAKPDLSIVEAWLMQAHNTMRPHEESVQLYIIV